MMKRVGMLIALAGLVMFPPALAWSEEAPESEIVYRANLGRADDVALLIRQGASPDTRDKDGTPILMLAAARQDPEGMNVVKTIIMGGGGVNSRDRKGRTALFVAAKQGNIPLIRYLLDQHADLYALDSGGNTARLTAHRAGHKEVVEFMDEYIQQKTEEAIQQQIRNEELRQQYQTLQVQEAVKARMEAEAKAQAAVETAKAEAAKLEAARAEIARLEAEKAQAAKAAPQASAPMPRPEDVAAAERKREEEITEAFSNMAYSGCAFQYWSFCLEAEQKTDLDSEEMTVAIDTHKERAETLKQQLVKHYGVAVQRVDDATDSAQQRIYKQLKGFAANSNRLQAGVGSMDDMRERCGEIGRQWQVPPAPPEPTPAPKSPPNKSRKHKKKQ